MLSCKAAVAVWVSISPILIPNRESQTADLYVLTQLWGFVLFHVREP